DSNFGQAEFVKSSKRTTDCPSDGLPVFALVGLSNVGKSSLLNSLVRRKRLALTSKKPAIKVQRAVESCLGNQVIDPCCTAIICHSAASTWRRKPLLAFFRRPDFQISDPHVPVGQVCPFFVLILDRILDFLAECLSDRSWVMDVHVLLVGELTLCSLVSKESHRLFFCPLLRSTFIPALQLPVALGWQFLRQYCPLMALPSVRTTGSGDVLARSYASVVSNSANNPSFKIPLRFPMDIHGELGFIFSKTEMTKAAEEYKFAIVMKFLVGKRCKEVGKPKENISWQPKKFDIKGSSSGTKDDKEMEANIESLGERLRVTREDKNSNVDLENEKDVSEEECDGVWCDKENEEALEFMQLKGKESSELPKNRVDDLEIVLAENRLPGDSTMGYCSKEKY
ncbi:hypothetical protein ACLOJK_038672, partial [Asimina triloba]